MNADLVKELIKAKGYTYAQAAECFGISKMTLCSALRGADIRISTLRSIADGLGVCPSALILPNKHQKCAQE